MARPQDSERLVAALLAELAPLITMADPDDPTATLQREGESMDVWTGRLLDYLMVSGRPADPATAREVARKLYGIRPAKGSWDAILVTVNQQWRNGERLHPLAPVFGPAPERCQLCGELPNGVPLRHSVRRRFSKTEDELTLDQVDDSPMGWLCAVCNTRDLGWDLPKRPREQLPPFPGCPTAYCGGNVEPRSEHSYVCIGLSAEDMRLRARCRELEDDEISWSLATDGGDLGTRGGPPPLTDDDFNAMAGRPPCGWMGDAGWLGNQDWRKYERVAREGREPEPWLPIADACTTAGLYGKENQIRRAIREKKVPFRQSHGEQYLIRASDIRAVLQATGGRPKKNFN